MAELRVKSTGTLKLFESDNTSSVTIASPASLGADRTVTLPDASVTLASGTMLATDGDGSGLSGVGKVLQVVKSTVTTAATETTSTTAVEIDTNLRCTLTPASASSKFMVQFFTTVKCYAGENMAFGIYRSIDGGAYSKVNDGGGTEAFRQRNSDIMQLSTTLLVYDHPDTTDAVIYTPYFWCPSTGTVTINDNGMGSFTLATEVSS